MKARIQTPLRRAKRTCRAPLSSASTVAQTRCGFTGDTVTPIFPRFAVGSPAMSLLGLTNVEKRFGDVRAVAGANRDTPVDRLAGAGELDQIKRPAGSRQHRQSSP